MFERVSSFFQSLTNVKHDFSVDDPQVAAVALLFAIVNADGEQQNAEKHVLKDIVSREYEIAGADLKKLIDAGQNAYKNSIDLFVFTSTLKKQLNAEQRASFIGLLWEIAYADGRLFELEDNLIWRISELMGVDRQQRLALKKQVAQRLRMPQIREEIV